MDAAQAGFCGRGLWSTPPLLRASMPYCGLLGTRPHARTPPPARNCAGFYAGFCGVLSVSTPSNDAYLPNVARTCPWRSFHHNGFGDSAVACLAEGLKHCPNLRHL